MLLSIVVQPEIRNPERGLHFYFDGEITVTLYTQRGKRKEDIAQRIFANKAVGRGVAK